MKHACVWELRSVCDELCFSLLFSMVILYLRFGSRALQDNFVAELSTHYQNYILSLAGQDLLK